MAILEPRPAMVEAGVEWARAVVLPAVTLDLLDERGGGPAGVAAVAIHLVERRGEEHGALVARRHKHGSLKHRSRIRTRGKKGELDIVRAPEVNQARNDLLDGYGHGESGAFCAWGWLVAPL